jgi:triphosphatase
MAPHRDIELTLRLDPESLARARRSPWWRELGPPRRQSVRSTFFDTDDHTLHERDFALSTESRRQGVVQIVEQRLETGQVARSETALSAPTPDPSLATDAALPHALRKLTPADLHPIFDIDLKRETRRLVSPRTEIEVSLREGGVTAGDEPEPIHAIELKLVKGGSRELVAEARRLSDSLGGRLSMGDETDVGYALASDRRQWSRARDPRLDSDMTVAESFRRIVLNTLSHLTANDDCARLNLHVEGVHQCRIALRRLRSALKIYGPHLAPHRIARVEENVRWLGGILGAARDIDVLQTELIAPAMESLGEGGDLAPLMADLAGKQAAAYVQVGEALGSERYRGFLIDLFALGHAGRLASPGQDQGDHGQGLAAFAAGALARLHRKLLKRGRDFETLSKSERHRVRIALKRLRYALDFFAELFDSEKQRKFFKRLARLQDDLGGMNDVAVAETVLMRLIGVQADSAEPAAAQADGKLVFAAGRIIGWHRRRAAELDRKLVKDWHAFVRAKPFWPEPAEPSAEA